MSVKSCLSFQILVIVLFLIINLVRHVCFCYQVELCSIKKDRAEQLLAALGGEKTRWTDNAHHLAQVYIFLTGGVFAYMLSKS